MNKDIFYVAGKKCFHVKTNILFNLTKNTSLGYGVITVYCSLTIISVLTNLVSEILITAASEIFSDTAQFVYFM